jgi:hypothetical protein
MTARQQSPRAEVMSVIEINGHHLWLPSHRAQQDP